MMNGGYAENSYLAAAATQSPLTALQYASYLLNGNTANVPVSTAEFSQGTAPFAMMVADHTSNTIYFYHPLYSAAQPAGGSVTSLGLSSSATESLVTSLNNVAIQGGFEPMATSAGLANWEIIVIGVALIAAGVAISVFSFGTLAGGSTLLLALGVGMALAGTFVLTASAYQSVFSPQVSNYTGLPNGGFCETVTSASLLGGAGQVVCIGPDGKPTSITPIGPGGAGGTASQIQGIAIGLAAIAAVGIGGYFIFKYVSKKYSGPAKPSSGFSL